MQNPRISVVVIGILVSFLISLVNYFVLDKEKMKALKEKQKALQEKMKKHKNEGNHEKMMETNKEFLAHQMEMMRHSFKPLLITMIPVLVLITFIRGLFVNTEIASSWFWYYLVSAIFGSIISRKVLKLP